MPVQEDMGTHKAQACLLCTSAAHLQSASVNSPPLTHRLRKSTCVKSRRVLSSLAPRSSAY